MRKTLIPEVTGVKLSDKAKVNVSEGMEKVIAKRDEGLKPKLRATLGAMKAQREVQREIDRTFKQLIRDVPAGPVAKKPSTSLRLFVHLYAVYYSDVRVPIQRGEQGGRPGC